MADMVTHMPDRYKIVETLIQHVSGLPGRWLLLAGWVCPGKDVENVPGVQEALQKQ